jgi:L-asparaginase
MSKKLVILGTGGTIAGLASDSFQSVSYQAAQLGVADLLARALAHQESIHGLIVHTEQVLQLDSKDLDFSQARLLAQRVAHHLGCSDVAGIVITHGTDTLEESAYFLSSVLPASLLLGKAVVFTCAMRPATALLSDGPQNLYDALVVAANPHSQGVLVMCAGVLHAAAHVQKVHPYRLEAFESVGACPVAVVEDGQLRILAQWPQSQPLVGPLLLQQQEPLHWPRVELVMNFMGADGALVQAICSAQNSSGQKLVQGLIVAGTGNGTLSQSLEAALCEAQSQGITVWLCSRCPEGHVVIPAHSTPLIALSPVASPVKARVALMLNLMNATFPS